MDGHPAQSCSSKARRFLQRLGSLPTRLREPHWRVLAWPRQHSRPGREKMGQVRPLQHRGFCREVQTQIRGIRG
ncbi:UNVERIFIED_CONTAM: hypothetical protein GTU68_002691 [Idotea baltica]|nr:hypothetical protein [Idotea baltica]